jgi:hypothetical protein
MITNLGSFLTGYCVAQFNTAQDRWHAESDGIKQHGYRTGADGLNDVCESMARSGIGRGNSVHNRPRSGMGLRRKQCEGSPRVALLFWTCGLLCWRNSDRGKTCWVAAVPSAWVRRAPPQLDSSKARSSALGPERQPVVHSIRNHTYNRAAVRRHPPDSSLRSSM